MERTARHLVFATIAAGVVLGSVRGLSTDYLPFKLSIGTAYASLGFLSAALLVGPLRVLRGGVHPTSTHFRRDLGIWAGLLGVTHVIVGLQVHAPGKPWEYFVWPAGQSRLLPLRYDLFGLANHVGLLLTALLVLLLGLSNDASLRRLGAGRWKRLQRATYFVFGLLVVHGIAYLSMEHRLWPWGSFLALPIALVAVLQVLGLRHLGDRR